MFSLSETFAELQKGAFKFSKEGINNLICIINNIKEFVEKITKQNHSIFDKIKSFLSSN